MWDHLQGMRYLRPQMAGPVTRLAGGLASGRIEAAAIENAPTAHGSWGVGVVLASPAGSQASLSVSGCALQATSPRLGGETSSLGCSKAPPTQEYDVRHWAKKFDASPRQIKEAVQAVGDRATSRCISRAAAVRPTVSAPGKPTASADRAGSGTIRLRHHSAATRRAKPYR